MATTRHLIVCEGESERAYLQRLQTFLDAQTSPQNTFEPALCFIAPSSGLVKTGYFNTIKNTYNRTRRENKNASIQVWADFDLYHRNDKGCAELYANKSSGVPDFLFSFHNFEDFFALHFSGKQFAEWLSFGAPERCSHFTKPLHSEDYVREFRRIFPDYAKGGLPAGFVSWATLRNLKANLLHQPNSNPHNLQGIRSFAAFLIREIEQAYPGHLTDCCG